MTKNQTGANRYWGTATPSTSKAEFFDAVTTPAPSGDGDVATIRLYGPVDSWGGWWGVSAEDVSAVLDALPESVTRIILRVNSPGGEVFEALAILNMLRSHSATVTAVVDGLAASAASFLVAGCDETVMSPGTQMMIHSPLSWNYGNATELRKTAEVLDGIEESIISIYRDKAGESAWGELLAAETWFTASQAVEAGLADRVAVIKDAGETSTAGADTPGTEPLEGGGVDDLYQAARARLNARPSALNASPIIPVSSEPGNTRETENLTMSDTFLASVRERLGVTDADASEETVITALDEALAEQADTPAAPAAIVPSGALIMDKAAHEQLVSDAAKGRKAMDAIDAQRREGIIATAMREGRIAANAKDNWRDQLDKDEAGITNLLASFPKNTVPVEEIGNADALTSSEDALYGRVFGSKTEES